MNRRRRVRVTTIAVNILTATPIKRVKAKPITGALATILLPNQYRIPQTIKVVILLSLIAVQARLNQTSIAAPSVRSVLSSSFIRSKMRILASTAMPIDKTKPPIPARLRVTGISLNNASTSTP